MPESSIAPAPGPEIKLGAPQNQPATMPNSILAAAMKAAGAPEETEQPSDTPEPPKAPPAPAKAQEKAPEKPVAPVAKPAEVPKEPKALREAYERATAKAEELTRSLDATSKEKADAFRKAAELEAKLMEREKKIAEDYEPRVQRLDAAEKRIQQTEELLRTQNYMATPEFHDKYNAPIAEVEADIDRVLSQSYAIVDGQQVPATREHFQYILKAKTLNDAGERAEELFGKHVGPYLANQRAKLVSLDETRQKAAKDASLKAIEYEKRNQSAQAQAREMLRQKVAERESTYISEFKPPEDDPELNAAYAEGRAFADEVDSASPQTMGPDKFADVVAKARAGIMERSVVKKKLSVANAKIAALEQQLAAYHKSDPDVETRRGGKPAGTVGETTDDKLLAAAMKLATGQK
jgi:hypothetical protein